MYISWSFFTFASPYSRDVNMLFPAFSVLSYVHFLVIFYIVSQKLPVGCNKFMSSLVSDVLFVHAGCRFFLIKILLSFSFIGVDIQ
jgi:hypothetical protein